MSTQSPLKKWFSAKSRTKLANSKLTAVKKEAQLKEKENSDPVVLESAPKVPEIVEKSTKKIPEKPTKVEKVEKSEKSEKSEKAKPRGKSEDSEWKPKDKKSKKKKVKVDAKQPLISNFIRRSSRVPTGTKRKQEQELMRTYLALTEDKSLNHIVVKETEEKGRGVYATRRLSKGEFVVEYAGDLLDIDQGIAREETYSQNPDIGCYMYFFEFKSKRYCIDATSESGRVGRLLNHSKTKANCKTRLVEMPVGLPRLIIEAKRDIKMDEELQYDYGDRSSKACKAHPWLLS